MSRSRCRGEERGVAGTERRAGSRRRRACCRRRAGRPRLRVGLASQVALGARGSGVELGGW